MLLKRFEVTIQTFLDKYKDDDPNSINNSANNDNLKEGGTRGNIHIRNAIEAQQKYLESKPISYEVFCPFPLIFFPPKFTFFIFSFAVK
jgi:hypothetical protein